MDVTQIVGAVAAFFGLVLLYDGDLSGFALLGLGVYLIAAG